MKKCVVILLCVCSLCALSAAALAADIFEYTDNDWKILYGIPEPQREDYADSASFSAAWDSWYSGFSAFIIEKTQAEYARQAEEAARLAAEEAARKEAKEQEGPAPIETTPTKPIESAGSNNGNNDQALDHDAKDKYPLGSYVDPDGVVWSPDGTRLSSSSAPGIAPASGSDKNDSLLSGELGDLDNISANADIDTLALIAEMVSDIATDPPVFTVEDLRSTDAPVEILTGLKALVTSIFGEYTPVTTTSVVSQTAGNDTHQYLVETVAPGAAGVDYEWLAGVFLFGILLFCLMKLLGGIIK